MCAPLAMIWHALRTSASRASQVGDAILDVPSLNSVVEVMMRTSCSEQNAQL